ncbi:MAG: hypothetical protein QNJ51_11465 [Calothrix sp. MO_167.B12]|nr:hypothetical protein [Calothrix sp. MO_167.B12]
MNVIEPSQKTDDEQEKDWLSHLYHSKTTDDKEAFAHRYADEFRAQLLAEKYIPFPRLFDEAKMILEHLNLEWFH